MLIRNFTPQTFSLLNNVYDDECKYVYEWIEKKIRGATKKAVNNSEPRSG